MIRVEGYSNHSRQEARHRIEQLKANNHDEMIQRKQKIKELSKQTNNLRKKLEEKKKFQESKEERRRSEILKTRRLKQEIATEKYQRSNSEATNNKNYRAGDPYVLKDGRYKVRGHIIEIKDGVRVNSFLDKNQQSNTSKTNMAPSQTYTRQENLYSATDYLANHVNSLLTENIVESDNKNENITDIKISETEKLLRQLDEERREAMTAFQLFDKMVNNSLSDSLNSNDSLNESTNSETKLKSSLRDSNKLRDSFNRKVTFSQSIQFDDGNSRPLISQAAPRMPLYKRINNEVNKEASQSKDISREEDLSRQNMLLPQYPQNNDYSYPESVNINHASNIAVVSPMMSPFNRTSSPTKEILTKSNATNYSSEVYSQDSLNSLQKATKSLTPDISNGIDNKTSDFINILSNIQNRDSVVLQNNSMPSPQKLPDNKKNSSEVVKVYQQNLASLSPAISAANISTKPTSVYTSHVEIHRNKPIINQAPNVTTIVNQTPKFALSQYPTTSYHNQNIGFFNTVNQGQQNTSSRPPLSHRSDGDMNINTNQMFEQSRRRNSVDQVNGINNNYTNNFIKQTSTDKIASASERENGSYHSVLKESFSKKNSSDMFSNEKDSNYPGQPFKADEANCSQTNVSDQNKTKSYADKIYDQVEKDLANLTFDKVRENFFSGKKDERQSSNDNVESSTANNKTSSIPVRIHNSNPSAARRGRIIVSANAKKRKAVMSQFTPHPPTQFTPHPPTQHQPVETAKTVVATNNHVVTLNTPHEEHYITKPAIFRRNRSSSANAVLNHRTPETAKNISNSVAKRAVSAPKHRQDMRQSGKPNSTLNLNKTPTDDEINQLWSNVRECLDSDRSSDHAYSDSVCMRTGNGKIKFERSNSGTNFTRKNSPRRINLPISNRISTQFPYKSPSLPNNLNSAPNFYMHHQGSGDSLNSASNDYARRLALLPSRPTQFINSGVKETPLRKEFITSRNVNGNFNQQRPLNGNELTDSLHSFMALEELCTKQSITPRKAEAIIWTNNKQHGYGKAYQKYGMSALSLEEQCVMDSLDRLNNKLKERGALIT